VTAFQTGLPAETGQDMQLETSDRKPLRIGLIILLVTFGIFGLWALLAPLDSAALAPGVVTVKGNRKTVQHLEGGIVADILVADGETVKAGDPLVILDATQARAELGVLRGQYYSSRALESRLLAERDDLEAVAFAQDLDVEDSRAEEAKLNEVQIFNARRNARLGETEVLEQRIDQLQSQIKGLKALIASKRELRASFSEEIKDLDALLAEGFVDKVRLREMERSLSRTEGEIADHQSSIAQAEMKIGETRLEILQLNKKFKTEVVDQLAEAQAKVFDLSERITAIQDKVERTVIRAPVEGIVLGLSTHTIGGVVQSGKPLLDIVPENQELVVDARVSPADIDRVAVGTEAKIRFSAFKNATTPQVQGRVVKISADRLVDEQSGEPYYQAKVEVTEEGLKSLEGLTLVPGMPAEVLIKTGERTLFQYLVQPATNAFARSLIEE
jgi:epimerase transport system membrane fusion protein